MPSNRHRRRASIIPPDEMPPQQQQQQTESQQSQQIFTSQQHSTRASSNGPQPDTSRSQQVFQSTASNLNNGGGNQGSSSSKIDMTHQNSGQQVIFGLYPQHASGAFGANNNNINMNDDLNQNQQQQQQYIQTDSNGNTMIMTRKVFYQQPDGRFTDATGELKNRQQRIAAQHQFDALRAQVPDWSADDDAKTFAPFFLYLVFALTHVRRMITGAAAGFSMLILIAIYWAEQLKGVSVDTATGLILQNATVGGAYETLCLDETFDAGQCSSIVAYAAIYRPCSYFFILASLLCSFISLVPFVFDIALMRQRSISDNIEQMQHLQGVQNIHHHHQHKNDQNNHPQHTGIAATTTTTLSSFGNPGDNIDGKRDANTARMLQSQSSFTPYIYMGVRHLLASTFPLFVIALITCMVTATVEIDRRKSTRMVEITSAQQNSIRTAIILRSVMFILAWVGSFRFREPTATDEVLNADAVIDLRS